MRERTKTERASRSTESMLSLRDSSNKSVIDGSKELSNEQAKELESKIEVFRALRSDLNTDIQFILEKTEAYKSKIAANLHGEQNPAEC